jgi:hypothetical protein
MKCSWKFLLLVFLFVGFVISCSEPPNARMAELQRYYALKGEGMTPTIKKVEQRNTTQGGTTPHLSTTNAPVTSAPASSATTTNVSTTDLPPTNLSPTNVPATIAPATNAPAPR